MVLTTFEYGNSELNVEMLRLINKDGSWKELFNQMNKLSALTSFNNLKLYI